MFTAEDAQAPALQDAEGNDARNVGANGNANGNNGEPREKRTRDRYGRDRGPRGERPPRHDFTENGVTEIAAGESLPSMAQAPVIVQLAPQQAYTPATPVSEAVAPASTVDVPAVTAAPAAPVPEVAAAKPVAAPLAAATAEAVATASMPKVSSYALQQDDLMQVAQGSGLQWVNTNAESVAKVQAAIAAEPQAVHVPRERPASVSIDAGPLVLVETKRDLRNMTLPFEETTPS
jgi:ribonuclease E